MKWRLLGLALRAAAFAQREPERAALIELGEELRALESGTAAAPAPYPPTPGDPPSSR